jgi:purine-binding chemotaxis protein CheW
MKKKKKVDEIIKEIDEQGHDKKEEEKIFKELLILDCHSRFIGVQMEYLREVFELKDDNSIAPIPFTPSYVFGIINVRGEIVPVLSLSEILHIEEKEFNLLRLVVIEKDFKIAFTVKNILDIKHVDVKNIRTITHKDENKVQQFVSDEFDHEGNVVSILDVPKLYRSEYIA